MSDKSSDKTAKIARTAARLKLEITALDSDGFGVGIADGLEIHVRGALPSETVECEIEHRSPHAPRAWAKVHQIIVAASSRVAPRCAPFGRCGGCPLAHLEIGAQAAEKKRHVANALAEVVSRELLDALHIDPPEQNYGYRNKAKFVIGPAASGMRRGKVVLGSYAPRSHDIVDMAGCAVIEEPLQKLAALADKQLDLPIGSLKHLVLRSNHAGQTLAVGVAERAGDDDAKRYMRALVHDCDATGALLQVNDSRGDAIFSNAPFELIAGSESLTEQIGPAKLELSAGAFFQTHRTQATKLYDKVRELAELTPTDRALDLYAGVGGIALTLLPHAAVCEAVESFPSAAADARKAYQALGRDPSHVHCEDAESFATTAATAHARYDVVVLDPPRKGASPKTLEAAAQICTRTLIYVSCEPSSLARDLARLADHDFVAVAIAAYDLFPHTPHVETIVKLQKRKAT